MSNRINYEEYYAHVLELNPREKILQAAILPELPDVIIDSHVHSSASEHYDPSTMSDKVYEHMMSTFPVTDLEMSASIDEHLMPGITVRKVRFAHAYAGIDHFGVTDYLLEQSPPDDAVVAFGLSDSQEQIERTIDAVRTIGVSGLKMYYLANGIPKSELYDYFPKPILDAAQEVGKPIILHLPHSLYNSQDEVLELATRYPDLGIVLAHMGVAHVPREGLGDILDSFAKHENVFADTSQVHDSGIIAAGLKHLGADKLLYGSDEPLNLLRAVIYDNPVKGPRILTDHPYHWVDPQEYEDYIDVITTPFIHSEWQQLGAILEGMKLAGITDGAEVNITKKKIFHDNAAAIFGLK
jgi:predicted TIM-barrel fold metal-dependent hydrolase